MTDKINKFIEDCIKADTLRDQGLEEPNDMAKIENIRYSKHGDYGLLDLYFLKDDIKKFKPIIVSTHGGAYCYGSKEVYKHYCMSLARHGFAVINYNYRLTPKYHFPDPLKDLNLIMTGIAEHQKEFFNIDKDNIFLVGDSAGAQITSQYAAIWSNEEYAKEFDFKVPDINIRAIALNCGFYDIKNLDLQNDDILSLLSAYWNKDISEYGKSVDVINSITFEYPATFIMTSNEDFLNSCAKPFSDVLKAQNVENVLKIYGNDKEKLYHVFHCDVKKAAARRCNEEECNFFKVHIG